MRVLIGYVHVHEYTKLKKGTGRQLLDFTLNYCIIYISLTIGTIKCGIIIWLNCCCNCLVSDGYKFNEVIPTTPCLMHSVRLWGENVILSISIIPMSSAKSPTPYLNSLPPRDLSTKLSGCKSATNTLSRDWLKVFYIALTGATHHLPSHPHFKCFSSYMYIKMDIALAIVPISSNNNWHSCLIYYIKYLAINIPEYSKLNIGQIIWDQGQFTFKS